MCTTQTVLQHNQTGSKNIYIFFRQTPKGTALECVKLAIDVGYRHFDGALVYFNEHEVGQAIREKIADGTVRREDIFYCGKVAYMSSIIFIFQNVLCFSQGMHWLNSKTANTFPNAEIHHFISCF